MPALDYKRILKKYWGYDDFRGIQLQIIESIGEGRDTLGLMPTGGGKSVTFQVPALAQEGVCVVVTPLIALMRDQVDHLRHMGIRATAVYSGMSRQEILRSLDNCVLGNYKFLYVSPERLESPIFQRKLIHMDVSFITVDEAHCISQWGYDFRPSYLQIAKLRLLLPQSPILALTATATPEVVEDIQTQLKFRERNVLSMSFARPNLSYIVREATDKFTEMKHILDSVTGSAIIYTRNRQQTKDVALRLQQDGITASFYHAVLPQAMKDERQTKWQKNEFRVMVATNAFGMGIDKADVRVVIHYEVPDSPEAYFQEAGRAGRDGKRSYAVLLYDQKEIAKLRRRVGDTYPDPKYVKDVYEHVCYYFQMAMGDGLGVTREFDLENFCLRYKYFPPVAHSALLLLNNAGYITYREAESSSSRVQITSTREDLYRIVDSPLSTAVLEYLMRRHSGLFSQYVYIDEYDVAKAMPQSYDCDNNTVYNVLRGLAQRGVLDYVPRKSTNYITFEQRRVEKDEIVLPPIVYKDRKEQYEKRLESIITYVSNSDVCRSRFLLAYFGEQAKKDCGQCDVCLAEPTAKDCQRIRDAVVKQLHDGPMALTSLDYTGLNEVKFRKVVRQMLMEEEIRMDAEKRVSLRS